MMQEPSAYHVQLSIYGSQTMDYSHRSLADLESILTLRHFKYAMQQGHEPLHSVHHAL